MPPTWRIEGQITLARATGPKLLKEIPWACSQQLLGDRR